MTPAAVGFRVHSGWTAIVVLGGPWSDPCVLARSRVELVKTFTYRYRQPYHTAAGMELEAAREFITSCQTESKKLALEALRKLQQDLSEKGRKVARCGLLLSSGRPLPGLREILASHALIHTADGELFRCAIVDASQCCGIPVRSVKERDLQECARTEIGLSADGIKRYTADLGRSLGPPWGMDEKLAALVAWLALARSP